MNDNLLLNACGGDSKRTKTFRVIAIQEQEEESVIASNLSRTLAEMVYGMPCKCRKKVVDEETGEDVTKVFID